MALAIPLTLQVRRILIFTDNKSAIRSIHKPRKSSGQSIIQDHLEVIQKLQMRGIDTELHWVRHIWESSEMRRHIAAKKLTG